MMPINRYLTCQEARSTLERYLARATDARETQLVAEHLEACAECLQLVTVMALGIRPRGFYGAVGR